MKSPEIFNFDYLKSHVFSLMPKPPVKYMVTPQQQQREIESLKETLGGRRFFFVNNLEDFETTYVHGVSRWLGYSEKDFTMKWYLDHVVHPGKRKSIILLAEQIYKALCAGKYPLKFMVERYSTLVALKHYNGGYLLANKISSVFQHTNDNRLTAYLNEFTILKPYEGEPLGPDFFNEDGTPQVHGNQILKDTIDNFLKLRLFANRELQLARAMNYNPAFTKAEIGETMKIEQSTVKELGKRLKENAETIFDIKFSGVADVVHYLTKEGLL